MQRTTAYTDAYCITTTLVTNHQYAVFIQGSGRPAPDVDRMTWEGYGLIHPFDSTRRFAWTNGVMPAVRGEHPVVLVSLEDAKAYAAWLNPAHRLDLVFAYRAGMGESHARQTRQIFSVV